MKSPLAKRYKRQLKSDFSKYLVIFLMLVLSISATTGFEAACNSTTTEALNNYEKLNLQDGNFVTKKKLNSSQIKLIEEDDVTVYEEFYQNITVSDYLTMRIYKNRTVVDKTKLFEGRLPEAANEIAIERLSASNNNLEIGDTVNLEGNSYTITGLISLPDYSSLFENNSDMMFNALVFSVAVVSEEGFNLLPSGNTSYCYVYKLNNPITDEVELNDFNEDLRELINDNATLDSFTARADNQAINFVLEDAEGDSASMYIFLYIMIILMAFIFGINIKNTINSESTAIGTLKALGYSDKELLRHYMFMPTLISIISAILGNILGYTVLEDTFKQVYYINYSLAPYVSYFQVDALLKITLVSVVLMFVINYFTLRKTLKLKPLNFLKHNLKKKKKRRAIHLSHKLKFITRFRLRVLLENKSSYLTLFIGIILANLLLFFGLGLTSILENYKIESANNAIAPYQTILNMPVSMQSETRKLNSMIDMMDFANSVETKNETAEKFSYYELTSMEDKGYAQDEIAAYGISDDSAYFNVKLKADDCYISSAYQSKYGTQIGDYLTFGEDLNDKTYTFKVTGVIDNDSSLAIFMTRDTLNDIFDLGNDTFVGYFSDTAIEDIDSEYISQVITADSLAKLSNQLLSSMGGMISIFSYFAIVLFLAVVYLLSKFIIDKNALNISLCKIVGYRNGEVAKLYVVATFIVVIITAFISVPICFGPLVKAFEIIMYEMMQGYLSFNVDKIIAVKMVAMNVITYGVVALLEYRRITKIRMDIVLKNME